MAATRIRRVPAITRSAVADVDMRRFSARELDRARL